MSDMTDRGLVYIVDDDPDVRESLSIRLKTAGYTTKAFATAREFLAGYVPGAGCLILDLHLPDIDGLELQRHLTDNSKALPVIVITAYPELAIAVEAMKLGALDFIAKPFDDEILLARVAQALEKSQAAFEDAILRSDARTRLESLTAREKQVLARVASGASSRMIASDLGISQRTVEVHRANIMHKAKVQNLAELLQLASWAGLLR